MAVSILRNYQVEEQHLLRNLGYIFDGPDNPWDVIAGPFVRVAFHNSLTKPQIERFTLANESSERRVTLSKALYDPEDYMVYGDGSLNGAHVTETEETETSITLIFKGINNPTPVEVAVYSSPIKKTDMIEIHIAEHLVVRSGNGHLFGFARHGVIKKRAIDIGQPMPYCFFPNYTPARTWGTGYQIDTSIFDWAEQNKDKFLDRSKLYTYQLEQYPMPNVNMVSDIIGWDNAADIKRAALDMEVLTTQWGLDDDTLNWYITQEKQENYQSPIVESYLRLPQADQVEEIGGISIRQTNWWDDSIIRISGSVNFSSAMLILNVDTAPVWEKNATPSVPIYLGSLDVQLIPGYDGAIGNAALFAGTAVKSTSTSLNAAMNQSQTFDYSDPTNNASSTILPLLKAKSYYSHPSNGIDSVMVRRTRWGSRYQSHYLQWLVPPNTMPPLRINEDTDGMYPRAWRGPDNPAYGYQFNPSRYSEKVHASKAQVVHPEDGVFGTLQDVILVVPYSLADGDELEVDEEPCSVGGRIVYEYQLTEAVSPLTKKPGTAFRPAALGIRTNFNE